MKKVAIIGIVGESVFLSTERLPVKGETVHAKEMFTELGGKGFNQAVAVARFGVEVSFLGAVGKDGYKQKVTEFCRAEKITPFLVEKEGRTAYAVIHTGNEGENFVSVYAGAQLTEQDVDDFEKEIQASQYLLLTNEIPLPVLYRAVQTAEKHGVKIILNPAPYRALEKTVKDKIFLFTPNEHECLGLEEYQNVVVTMGKKGCFLRSLRVTLPPTGDKAVDTTGAGDTFNGALTAMLTMGEDLREAVDIANRAAGKSVTKKGAATSVPYPNEL